MKVLQVIPYFCFGGAETMCENLTYGLMAQGHDVCVVSLYPERTPIARRMEEAGVRIRYLDKKLGLDVSMVTKLSAIMKEEKPDVVHTHLDVIKYAVAAAKLRGIPKCVHTVHNVAQKEAEGKLQKLINGFYFRMGWSVPVALSPQVRDTIVDFYGLPQEKVPVIFNGVDLSRCIPKESYDAGENLKLVHIGRFNEQKNHRRVLEAFSLFAKNYTKAQLWLLGDGEQMEPTKAYAKELSLGEKVRFLGSQNNVYPYLHEADLFLLPSDYEGMPMTIIEAMGTGLPVVATAVGGVPDMISHRVSGLLTELTAQSVAEACEALAADEALREKLGKTAREESRRFSADFMAQRYAEEYQK